MASKKKQRAAEKRPKFKRAVFTVFVVALAAIGIVLDLVVLPRGGAHFEELGIEQPAIVSLGLVIEAFIHAYLWPLVGGVVALAALAWIGAFDRVLKPGIALALLALLVLGGVTAGTWNANEHLIDALDQSDSATR